MYHSVSDRDADVSHAYYQTNTKPEIFARQMQFLADNNYKVITLTEAIDLISGHSIPCSLPVTGHRSPVTEAPRYAVLTFDDGFRDFYDNAFPVMSNYGFHSTVFLPTGVIDNDSKVFKGRECLNWDQVRSLSGRDVTFGSHTKYHHQLYLISRDQVADELKQSKEDIEHNTGHQANTFSYPYAFPDHDVEFIKYLKGLLQQIGYKYGVTTRIGTISKSSDLYFLKRLPVNSGDDIELFTSEIRGSLRLAV